MDKSTVYQQFLSHFFWSIGEFFEVKIIITIARLIDLRLLEKCWKKAEVGEERITCNCVGKGRARDVL